ncbi:MULTISPECIES: hypothetical protein [Microbacterium]|uniref:hypothetical protein n=1 Tax=Microbacterium TaxID=33882 RepID=UPI00344E32E4
MSGLDDRRFRRLLAWYPRSWRRDHGDVLLAMMLDDAERTGRSGPTGAERRAAIVHGLGARLGATAAIVVASLAILATAAGQVGLLFLTGGGVAFHEPMLFVMTGVAPALTGVALVAVLRAVALLGDGAALIATACLAVAGVCCGVAGIGWSQGFDAADAGLPQPGLAAVTLPLAGAGVLLTGVAFTLLVTPALRRVGLGRAALALAIAVAIIAAPVTGALVFFSPGTTAVVAIVVLVVAALPLVRGVRREASPVAAPAPTPRSSTGGAVLSRVLAGIALAGGAVGLASAFAGADWSPTARGDDTAAMREGIVILALSMIPALVALGVVLARSRRRAGRDTWIPVAAAAAGFAAVAADYLVTDGSGAVTIAWVGAAAAIGLALAWWVVVRMPLSTGRGSATGIRVGVGLGIMLAYTLVLGLTLTPMLAFGAPVLALVVLVLPWRRRTRAAIPVSQAA